MKPKVRIFIVLVGLALAITGIVMLYQDYTSGKINYLPYIFFCGGVMISFKSLSKTKHKSRKFKLGKDYDNEED